MRIDLNRRLFVAGGAALVSSCGSPAVDYCTLGAKSTLVFIDITTPYDATDQREVTRLFGNIVEALGTGDRLSLRTIDEQYATSEAVFDDCKPGCPDDRSAMDEYLGTGCSTTQAQTDLDAFLGGLIGKIHPLLSNAHEAAHSDIVATISRSTHAYAEQLQYSELILYSDMLENSSARPWTWVRDQTEETLMNAISTSGLTSRVEGATVRIFGFGRVHNDQREQLPENVDNMLRGFWTRYFTEGGAREVLFDVPPSRAG